MSKKVIISAVVFVALIFIGVLYFIMHSNSQTSIDPAPIQQTQKITPSVVVPTNHEPEKHTD